MMLFLLVGVGSDVGFHLFVMPCMVFEINGKNLVFVCFAQNFFLESGKIVENHVCKCLGFFFSSVKFDTWKMT